MMMLRLRNAPSFALFRGAGGRGSNAAPLACHDATLRRGNGGNEGRTGTIFLICIKEEAPAELAAAPRGAMSEAEYLRKQAERCRWLAARIHEGDVAQSLLRMGAEYEERAGRLERGEELPEA